MPDFACIFLQDGEQGGGEEPSRRLCLGPTAAPHSCPSFSVCLRPENTQSLRDIFSSFLEGWEWFQGLGDGRKAPASSGSCDSAAGKHGRCVTKARNGDLRTKSAKSAGWEAPVPVRGEETARPAQAEGGKFYPVPGGRFRISLSRGFWALQPLQARDPLQMS